MQQMASCLSAGVQGQAKTDKAKEAQACHHPFFE
jgi:hypothetical protein